MLGFFRRPSGETPPKTQRDGDLRTSADQLVLHAPGHLPSQPIGSMVPAVLAAGIGTLVWVPDTQKPAPGSKPGSALTAILPKS